MVRSVQDYEELYRTKTWAYGDKPDVEFVRALAGAPRGKALDVGGGQGRHALALSALGFDVTLVDVAGEGLRQASEASQEKSLPLHIVQSDVSSLDFDDDYQVIVCALFFHQVNKKTALDLTKRMGVSLNSGGIFYLSLPGYNAETEGLARDLLEQAGCREEWLIKKLVTKKDRPKLQVARRNETMALGKALKRR
ncbi:MAG: class I SAM-dependent methyltransferase [Actinobacteria bacterium]|nr:class I SAM-dependent methyltransferase [Actinomycetota bacterium]